MVEPVKLRQRKRSNGVVSLYLDITIGGVRKYEYLNLYLSSGNSREEKRKNEQTLALARSICAKRLLEVRDEKFGFQEVKKSNVLFFEFFDKVRSKKEGHTAMVWHTAWYHLHNYEPNKQIRLVDITPQWLEGFLDYLKGLGLKNNTILLYYSKVTSALNRAVVEDVIPKSPALKVERPQKEDTERAFLTMDELRRFASTDMGQHKWLQTLFLFSCLTGLRWSDICALTWKDVEQNGDMTRLVFKQQKTKGQQYLDISEQASSLLPTPKYKKDEDAVFPICTTLPNINVRMKVLCKKAGIHKNISFHCARHTFAVMMLDLGVDIYTVSKLLGHKEVSTTQIYAKVLDKNKQEAVKRIPDIFSH